MARPRQPGAREPNGRLSRRRSTKPDTEPISPALWGRIKAHGKQLGLDPRLESELGRLHMHGEFTVAQTVAGFRIGEIYGRFERFKRLSRSPKSPSYNASYGEAGISEDLLLPEQIEDLERRIRESIKSWEELENEIPHDLRSPVQDLCVASRPINPVLYEDMRRLLSRLAIAWNVHGAPKGDSNGHAHKLDRHGPALHFNRHEDAEPVVVDKPKPKKPNFDRAAFIRVIRASAPHLTDDQVAEAYDFQQALKQRELFRRDKLKKGSNIVLLRPR